MSGHCHVSSSITWCASGYQAALGVRRTLLRAQRRAAAGGTLCLGTGLRRVRSCPPHSHGYVTLMGLDQRLIWRHRRYRPTPCKLLRLDFRARFLPMPRWLASAKLMVALTVRIRCFFTSLQLRMGARKSALRMSSQEVKRFFLLGFIFWRATLNQRFFTCITFLRSRMWHCHRGMS